ncbi:MAG: hypothetical protein JRH07_10710 [Deltaproteobacteria bacterium]|nr:hypothetical protein [Deltaproteobacteria bacterium]MBW2122302.1 hypothetical protein [Deltaproteobacteria bacterium]
MKRTLVLIALVSLLGLIACPPRAGSQQVSRLAAEYGGKVFKSPSDPDYLSYQKQAKAILLRKIRDRYGVDLNGENLSPDQLLEIEALLRVKRSDESVEYILNRFPGVLHHAPSS